MFSTSDLLDEGINLASRGQFEEAAKRFQEAARIDPDSAGAYVHLGRVNFRLGRMKDALTAFEAAVRLAPRSAAARKWYGITLLTQERAKDALAELGTAVALDPEVASTYLGLAAACRRLGRNKEAEQALKRAKRLNPKIDMDLAELSCEIGEETAEARSRAEFWWNAVERQGAPSYGL